MQCFFYTIKISEWPKGEEGEQGEVKLSNTNALAI